ncbi:hypothetical protein F5X68DRAFT_51085 [Plectosphaerella plurivora]|uniref:Arrestin C-terminal-like domain-containing protein n=1 Tax=Plectosphaerella plurivora TaxID=936078 RepID=A0A9P8V403_9PEZI|nr:hypothetical protein F5X68DRAFT_51085 [Plectosphaerella plurivora]
MCYSHNRFMNSIISRLTGGFHDASIRIQPSQDFVVLRGDKTTAPDQYLQGTILLRLPTPQRIQGVRLSMVGHRRVARHEPSLPAFGTSETTTRFEHTWEPFDIKPLAHTDDDDSIPAGNYEWPFELLIPGATPETTKGCSRCSIAYYLKADTIRDKPGSPPQGIRAIRIMRTLPTADFEMMDAITVEGTCGGKMAYTVSVSHKAVALGTSIPVEVDMTLPEEGWRTKSVTSRLVEVHRLEGREITGHVGYAASREVLGWDLLEMQNREDDVPEKELDEQGLHIAEELPLPGEASHCSPDVDALGIQVSHMLHVDLEIENEEGDVIKRHVPIPITLFVSPAMPINAQGRFIRTRSPSPVTTCAGVLVPPPYGCHFGDEQLEVKGWPKE